MSGTAKHWSYQLEQLYEDQEPDLAIDVIAQLICWLDPEATRATHRFELRQQSGQNVLNHQLTISWNTEKLATYDPRLQRDLQRLRAGRTLTGEDQVKYAAYGLAMVATSCILKRRVLRLSTYCPPDLLLDTTPGALRGVEVAGRAKRGYAALEQAIKGSGGIPGKRAQLATREDVAEAHLSLWCCDPKVSIWEKVKP